uniref:Pri n=1 Tax=Salmonella paratyphi B TaxID=57045 RepID=A0A0E3MU70_SALEB|nr:toprim domain-containing protein [Salmonella enterica]AKA86541.1 Pri [Salmonella enterica subsp. enterica serovar Paratyphi B]
MAKPEIATERTRLSIPFDDRQRAIRAAGKLADGSNALDYVKEEKVWYAQPGANLSRLKEWIFDPNKVIEEPPLDIQAIEDEFTAWLEERGAIIKDPIEFDGQKHYVDTVDGKAGSRKGVYAAFLDGRPAGWYRDYKNGGEIQKWVSTGAAPNPEQMAMLRADAAARREQRAAAQADKFDQTANRLMEEYNRLPDATGDLAYLKNKQVIAANGLKADERGNVVIPLFNADGEFRTLERIWSDGSKHLEKDGQAWGSFFVVGGQLKDGDNLLYAEGYATAASISEAINQPVIMTVNAGNMVEVAGRLKDAFPNSTHYFLADNDIYKDENVGLEKATEAAELTAGHVLVPAFSNPKEGLTDYNDLHVSEGLEQVRLQVEGAINQINRVDTMPTDNPNITDVNHSSTDSAAVAAPENAAPVASAPAAAEPVKPRRWPAPLQLPNRRKPRRWPALPQLPNRRKPHRWPAPPQLPNRRKPHRWPAPPQLPNRRKPRRWPAPPQLPNRRKPRRWPAPLQLLNRNTPHQQIETVMMKRVIAPVILRRMPL